MTHRQITAEEIAVAREASKKERPVYDFGGKTWSTPTPAWMALVDRLSQAGAGGVVVKPLEWERFWFGSNDDIRAWRPTNSIIGSAAFIISMDGDSWTEGTCEHGKFPNLAAAQAARQQEYNARIPAALAPSPSAPPGHTDLMVTPESIDAFLEANPPPAPPDQPTASVEAVAFPAYGEMPFSELGSAVKAAQFGSLQPYEFDPEFYPGHQIVGTINFNSLNRIVTWFVKRALASLTAPAQGDGGKADRARKIIHEYVGQAASAATSGLSVDDLEGIADDLFAALFEDTSEAQEPCGCLTPKPYDSKASEARCPICDGAPTPSPSPVSAPSPAGGVREAVSFMAVIDDAWQELSERDDRTSPEEYPDTCLITPSELAEFMHRAALSSPATPEPEEAGGEPEEAVEADAIDWYDVDPKPCSRCGSDRTFLNTYLRTDSAEVCRVECRACGYRNAEGFHAETVIVQWDAQWSAKCSTPSSPVSATPEPVAFDPLNGGCPHCKWLDTNLGRVLDQKCALHQKIEDMQSDSALDRGIIKEQAGLIRRICEVIGADDDDDPVERAKERMDEIAEIEAATPEPVSAPANGEVGGFAAGVEAAARFVEQHELLHTSNGDEARRRMEGNRAGLGYVAGIRALSNPAPGHGLPAGFLAESAPAGARWLIGSWVQKIRGSSWRGRVCGFYVTENTPIGYAVESFYEKGSVQVWPEAALGDWTPPAEALPNALPARPHGGKDA